jgi:predicted dehydrogenase
MSARLRIGLIGAGRMGARHARVIALNPDTELTWVIDPDRDIGAAAAGKFDATWMPELDFDRMQVDAVVVAAPTEDHCEIALEAVRNNVPMLIEKPVSVDFSDTMRIVQASQDADVPLMCGFVERFNPAIRTAFDLCRTPRHFRAVRHSPPADHIGVSVIDDLLIHDADLALRLFASDPSRIESVCDAAKAMEAETVEAVLQFDGGALASLSASRRSQRKIRLLTITEPDRMIEVDVLRQDLTIYRHVAESASDDDIGYQQQTVIDIPMLKHQGEPLALQLKHFVLMLHDGIGVSEERASVLPAHRAMEIVSQASVGVL